MISEFGGARESPFYSWSIPSGPQKLGSLAPLPPTRWSHIDCICPLVRDFRVVFLPGVPRSDGSSSSLQSFPWSLSLQLLTLQDRVGNGEWEEGKVMSYTCWRAAAAKAKVQYLAVGGKGWMARKTSDSSPLPAVLSILPWRTQHGKALGGWSPP